MADAKRLSLICLVSLVCCLWTADAQMTFEEHYNRIVQQIKTQSSKQASEARHAFFQFVEENDISIRSLLNSLHKAFSHDQKNESLREYNIEHRQQGISQFSIPENGERGGNVDNMNKLTYFTEILKRAGARSDLDSSPTAPFDDSGSNCLADVLAYASSIKFLSPWALSMIDATGKPTPGLLIGRAMWLGDFDECIATTAQYETKGIPRTFQGRYCSASYTVNLTSPVKLQFSTNNWGLCLPDSCNNEQAVAVVNFALQLRNITALYFTDMSCHSPQELPIRAIVVYVLVGICVALVVVATLIDLLLIQWPRWRQEALDKILDNEIDTAREAVPGLDRTDDDFRSFLVNSNHSNIRQINPGPVFRLLLSFSAWTNGQKLFDTRQPSGVLKCLNGIRVISISWVILGHCVVFYTGATENLSAALKIYSQRWTFEAIYNATVSVDTFFLLSGLLVAYLSLKEMSRNQGKINWFLFYFHRYLRLTPVYMMCLAIWAVIFPYWFDGPFFPRGVGFELNHCEDSWWGNLLYVNNLVDFKSPCFVWAWYLAADMQFYIVSPLIFVPLYFKPILGYFSAAAFFLGTAIAPYVITLTHYYSPGAGSKIKDHPKEIGDSFHELYTAPYCRMGPYIVGLLLGYLLYRTKGHVRMKPVVNLTGWAIATALALAVLYGLYDYSSGAAQIDLQLASFYNAFSRTAWSICVAWVVFACVTGYGGLINSFLSLPVWVPLSRLTYVAYLIHPIIFAIFASTRKTPFYMNDTAIVMVFLATLLGTYSVGVLVSLTFEAPVMGIEKVLLKREKRS